MATSAPRPSCDAVGEAGGGVDVYGGRIDRGDEAGGIPGVSGQDAVGVPGGMGGDVLDGLLQPFTIRMPRISDSHSVSKSCGPAGWTASPNCPPRMRQAASSARKVTPSAARRSTSAGSKRLRDGRVHQHGIQRVADGGALDLGVADDLDRAGQVGAFIDEQVADADAAGDDRDAAVLAAELVQPGPAARDDHIDIMVHLQQFVAPAGGRCRR